MNLHALLRLLCAAAVLSTCLCVSAFATTLNVLSTAYPTIQSGVDAAASGDTVLVADGTYTGNGNRDIDCHSKSLTVTSQNGPTKTILDCGGYNSVDGSGNHRGFSNVFCVRIPNRRKAKHVTKRVAANKFNADYLLKPVDIPTSLQYNKFTPPSSFGGRDKLAAELRRVFPCTNPIILDLLRKCQTGRPKL